VTDAEAPRPARESSVSDERTIRTSTGNIKVMKMPQNTALRNGKLKYTMAKALSKEMTILPNAMLRAVTKLTHIIRATGTWLVTPGPSPNNMVR